LNCEPIVKAVQVTQNKKYAELDPVFNLNIDEDYDFSVSGITRNSFCSVYLSWIQHCVKQRSSNKDKVNY